MAKSTGAAAADGDGVSLAQHGGATNQPLVAASRKAIGTTSEIEGGEVEVRIMRLIGIGRVGGGKPRSGPAPRP